MQTVKLYSQMLDNEIESYLRFLHHQQKLPLSEIAKKLQCSRPTVSRLFKKHSITVDKNPSKYVNLYGFKSLEDLATSLIKWSYKENKSQSEIAKILRCSRHTVMRLCNDLGINTRNPLHLKCGFKNEFEFKNMIQHLYTDLDLSISKISQKYGVSCDSIRWLIQKHKILKIQQASKEPTYDNKTSAFIKKSNAAHNGKYSYSKVHYKNNRTKVEIICPTHGSFWQTPYSHYSGHGCSKCSLNPLKLEEFIKKANRIHSNKYDYSKSSYKNTRTKTIITCKTHGDFLITPFSHLQGHGCKNCNKPIKKSLSQFIHQASSIHNNKYDYSKTNYINNKTPVTIVCPKHGEFKQKPSDHLKSLGCPFCAASNVTSKLRSNTEEFIKKSTKTHGDCYDYSKVEYHDRVKKVTITCKEHGDFNQSPTHHLRGSGCPKCLESRGEREVRSILEKHQINFETQKSFDKCKDRHRLKFDFYLNDCNTIIEFDGIQHFQPVDIFGGSEAFERAQRRDLIKNKFCLINSINLIRISYKQIGDIKSILSDHGII